MVNTQSLSKHWRALSLKARLLAISLLLAPCVVMWWKAVDYRIWLAPALLCVVMLFFLPGPGKQKGKFAAKVSRAIFVWTTRGFSQFAAVAFIFTIFASGAKDDAITQQRPSAAHNSPPANEMPDRTTLKVLTLNLAHGRANGFHQAMQSEVTIRQNLSNVAEMLRRESPTVVALQEADGPSVWSGGFDHVAFLAEQAAFPSFARAEHVRAWRLSYGTAMLSQPELDRAESHPFDPLPPLMPKGYLLTTISWPGTDGQDSGIQIDVVSVHLDFSLSANRKRQAQQMIAELMPRSRPLIVMGDFNCDLSGRRSALVELIDGLNLKVFQPESSDLSTFALTGKRIDWILISPELEFASYTTLEDELSDHKAVLAELRLAKE